MGRERGGGRGAGRGVGAGAGRVVAVGESVTAVGGV